MNVNSFNLAQGTMGLSDTSDLSFKKSSKKDDVGIVDYNGLLGNYKTVLQDIKDFQTIADKTTDQAEKERYTQAVKDATELLGKVESNLKKVSSALKLDPTLANSGKIITPEAYDAYKANGYKINGDVLSGMQGVKINRFQHPLLGTENDTGFMVVA